MSTANVIKMEDHIVPIKHDGDLIISYGKTRFEKSWKNTSIKWSHLLGKLNDSRDTPETHAEYMKMSKTDQDKIKDIGGFVGGHLKDGRRKNGNVAARQIITLDLDFAPLNLWEELLNNLSLDCAMAIYSTHKHSDKSPRYRLIAPLDRKVSADEYEAIARKLAEKVGMEWFDITTFQPTRLMYWPSNSADVAPVFKYNDAPFLNADEMLGEYPDWTDVSYWPVANGEIEARKKKADKQGDPLEKTGIIGAFNRAYYPITKAIDAFLPETYLPTDKPDRYTYAEGSTAAGVVIYDDLYTYSNHATDPTSQILCNAFDLIRLHKFGHLDEDVDPDTRSDRLPSFKAMQELASKDNATSLLLADERTAQALEDFKPLDEGEDWRQRLTRDKHGRVTSDVTNAQIIFTFDESLQDIRLNTMSGIKEATSAPWSRDDSSWSEYDDSQLYMFVANTYGVAFTKDKFNTALDKVTHDRRYHPVKDYLDNLPEWDGVKRVETLLIDYFGCEDNSYVREATRKTLTAAVARIYEPGIKFDNVLVLVGKQGIGKSTFFTKLAGEWFSDALTLADMKDKTAAEKLQGYWILELGEMAGMKKAEVEVVKSFISRQDDIYRAAYARNIARHKRMSIMVGSTNAEAGFLRDITGNRRFWPIKAPGSGRLKAWDITADTVRQIWAEVKSIYEAKEKLYLTGEAEEIAIKEQTQAMEKDERQGLVEEYLNKRLPDNWEDLDIDTRREILNGERPEVDCINERTRVSNIEIWTEAFGRQKEMLTKQDSYAISGLMSGIEGWERADRLESLKLYGRQRVYTKKVITSETIDLEDF